MILHFSHIGLTDGRTFTLASLSWLWVSPSSSLSPALEAASGRRYRAEDRHVAQNDCATSAAKHGSRADVAQAAAARPSPASCQGVRIRGPDAVTATVNSKCAASEPSWE